jgi:nucleoside-diphosphate-sugar epimerase
VRTVLLTGAAGQVGRSARRRLVDEGWRVRPFDMVTGGDLRDEAAVREAVTGCEHIVRPDVVAGDGEPSVETR